MTMDTWTRDNTKGSYLGMTAHWIEVIGNMLKAGESQWKLRSEVVTFQGIMGDHSGLNLGRYLLGLAQRVGIVDAEKQQSKVRALS